jgi:MFS family permease
MNYADTAKPAQAIATWRTDFTPGYRAYILGILFLTYFFNFMDRNLLGVLMPSIKADLQFADWQLGLLGGGAFAMMYAVAGIPIAWLVDRSNRVNILTVSIAFWSIMTATCGAATSFWQLLLARAGVGIGEAGSSPSCTTLISDLYGRKTRATAIGIYTSGLAFGSSAGLLFGALIAAEHGWRWAFVVVGLPGLLLALVMKLTVREPPRGLSEEPGVVHAPPTSIWKVTKVLMSRPTFRQFVLGHSLSSVVSGSFLIWMPSFMTRTFGVSLPFAGAALAVTTVVAGVAGAAIGGWAADKLSTRSIRWRMLLPAVTNFGTIPIAIIGYTTSNVWLALFMLCIAKMAPHTITGPGGAMVQEMVGLRMRASAQAINLFAVSVIAGTIGPFAIGLASDLLTAEYGDQALRIALLGSTAVSAWAAFHYYLASRHIEKDLKRVGGEI